MDFNEVGCDDVGWIQLALDRFYLWAVVNIGTTFGIP
jgi:hypothetical protein